MKQSNKIISLLPENYERNNFDYFFEKNYMEFRFFEHNEFVKKYITKKRHPNKLYNKKYLETIRFPISKGIFDSRVEVSYVENDLHFVGNLLYESAQKYGASSGAMINSMKETVGDLVSSTGDIFADIRTAYSKGELSEKAQNAVGDLWNKFSSVKTYEDLAKAIHESIPSLDSEVGKLAIGFGTALALDNDDSFTRGVKFSEGVAYNKNARPLFQGDSLDRRFFQITFQFFPKSKEEVLKIREAEYVLQKNSLPSLWTGSLGYSSKYINHFKEPKKIEVVIYIDGKPFDKYKILDSVIDLCTVTQNPDNSENTFIQDKDDGRVFATEFQVLIQFKETKIFTANDVDFIHAGIEEAYAQYENRGI